MPPLSTSAKPMSSSGKSSPFTALRRLGGVVRILAFGYDVFISYAHGAEATPYARRLEARLSDRDFTVFRDESRIHLGDRLSLVIRYAVLRSRSLVVIGTETSVRSSWVQREATLFSGRKRPVVILDLERLRISGALDEFPGDAGDRLHADDTLDGPGTEVIDRIVDSREGRRVNQSARRALLLVATLVAVLSGLSAWSTLTLTDRSRSLYAQSTLRIAEAHHDPVIQTLLLAETDLQQLPLEAERLARRLASAAVPHTVLRDVPLDFEQMLFTPDGRGVATVSREFEEETTVTVISVCAVDGESESRTVARIENMAPDEVRVAPGGQFIELTTPTDLTLVAFDGRIIRLRPPADFDEDDRWDWLFESPWRVWPAGNVALFLGLPEEIRAYDLSSNAEVGAWPAPGGVMDAWIHQDKASGLRATIVSPKGTLRQIELDPLGHSSTKELHTITLSGSALELPEDGLHSPPRALTGAARFLVALVSPDDEESETDEPDSQLLIHDLAEKVTRRWTPPTPLKHWTASQRGEHILVEFDSGLFGVLALDTLRLRMQPQLSQQPVVTDREFFDGQLDPDEDVDRVTTGQPVISPSGGHVLLPGLRFLLHWRVDGRPVLRRLMGNEIIDDDCTPVFSPDERTVATAEWGSIRLWSVDDAAVEPASIPLPGRGGSLVLTDHAMVIGCEGSVLRSEGAAPRILTTLIDGIASDSTVTLANDGSMAVIMRAGGRLVAHSTLDGSLIAETQAGPLSTDTYLTCSAGRVYFVEADRPTLLHRWVPESGARDTWEHGAPLDRIDVARRTGIAVTLDESGTFRRWGRDERLPLGQTTLSAEDTLSCLVVHPDGDRILAGIGPRIVKWEQTRGRLYSIHPAGLLEDEECWSLAFARGRWILGTDNGRLGISDRYGGTVEKWIGAPDIGFRESDSARLAHVGMIHQIDVSSDGGRFASHGAIDAAVRVWSLEGSLLASLKTKDIPWSSVFAPDGKSLVGITETSGVSSWSCSITDLVEKLTARTSATLLPVERQRYLGESATVARRRYEAAEKARGRVPLPPDRIYDLDVRF